MQDPSVIDIFGRMLPALALIIGGLLLVRRWAQRGQVGGDAGVRVVARTGVARNSLVAVVEAGERRFLVGAGDHGVSLLCELEPSPSLNPTAPLPTGSEKQSSAVMELAPQRPAHVHDRPWMGLIHRLQAMTVRTTPHPRKAGLGASRT